MAENLWKNYKPDTRPVGNLWTRAVAPSREVVGVEDEDDEGMTLGDQKIEAASSEPLEKPTTTEATQTLPPPDAAVPVDPVQPPSSVGGKESLPVDVLTTKDNSMTTQQSTTPTGTQQPQQPLMATASQTQTTSGVSGLASGEQQKRDELIKKLDTNIDKAFGALPPEAQERISGELLGFREGLKELYADPEREADIKAFKQEMKTLKNDLDEIKEKKVDPSRYMSQPRNVIGMLVGGVLTAIGDAFMRDTSGSGVNNYLKMIDTAVNRDIKSQIEAINRGKQVIGDKRIALLDEMRQSESAYNAGLKLKNKMAASLAQELKVRLENDPALNAQQREKAKAEINKYLLNNLAQTGTRITKNVATTTKSTPLDPQEIESKNFKSEQEVLETERKLLDAKSNTLDKINERAVTVFTEGEDGDINRTTMYAGDPDAAKNFRDISFAHGKIMDLITEMKKAREEFYSSGDLSPSRKSELLALSGTLKGLSIMEQKDKFQLGALTDADLRALDSIIMNPLDIGRVAPKLDQMQETYNTQYEIAMDNFNLSNKHGLEDVLNKRNESLDIIEKRKQKFSGGR